MPDDPTREGPVAAQLVVSEERDVARARRAVVECCEHCGLVEECDDAALLTSELVTNAVRHCGCPVQVTIDIDEGRIFVGVQDNSSHPPTRQTVDTSAESGRGLALVEELARDWGVRPTKDGKVVWFRL